MKKLFMCTLVLTLAGCQSHKSEHHKNGPHAQRSVANISILRVFLQEIERHAPQLSRVGLEAEAIRAITHTNNGQGIWQEIGITEEEARQITSLYDDLPFMNKVRNWVQRNATRLFNVNRNVAADAFTLAMRERPGFINPYTFEAPTVTAQVAGRRANTSPILNHLNQGEQRVLAEISSITTGTRRTLTDAARREMTSLQNRYRESLAMFVRRQGATPTIIANGQHIAESASLITKKTGLPGMGEGCTQFAREVSEEILSRKATIDLISAELVVERAYNKAGRAFEFFDEIPENMRLTVNEIKAARREAFKRVNALTDEEATTVLIRTELPPCRLY